MQYLTIEVVPTVSIILFTSILSAYLLRTWYLQENRLNTDLPLIFGVMFMGLIAVMGLQLLFRTGLVIETIELFRIRALMVGVITLPMLVALLNIWLQRRERHHNRIIVAVFSYWMTATFLGTNSGMIIGLVSPVMLILGIAMMVTFAITWKTGRLQEIRSGLLVIGLGVTLSSQVMRVPFDTMGLGVVVDMVLAIGMIIITLALTNPWKSY
ncbi:MAG: hypothetical protein RTU30_00485 [Candidatus Thorarchaeota archaeon]